MLSVVGSISLRGGSRMTTKALGALITAMGVVAGGLPAEAQGPIRIGASLSLTGTYAKLGRNQHEGYKLCVKRSEERRVGKECRSRWWRCQCEMKRRTTAGA